jgi:hypothetical protein
MKRMLRAAAAAAILTSGLGSIGCVNTGTCGGGSGGCGSGGNGVDGKKTLGDCYRTTNDPCYPERYNFAARQAVVAPFAQQAYNGHVLNQTIWNYLFEPGTDKLTPAGAEKLISIARERPGPDPRIYLQTSRDLPLVADPAKVPDVRADLDVRRAATVQKFLAAQPAFAGPVAYEIFVHDPATPSIRAEMVMRSYNGSYRGYNGGITGAAGIGALGTGSGNQGNLTVAPTSVPTGGGSGAPTGSSPSVGP